MKETLKAAFVLLGCTISLVSCSTAKRKGELDLSALRGKKVALVSTEGEPTAKSIMEVALVNQLIQQGTFILLPKLDLEKARSAPDIQPTDYRQIAQRAGADYALRIKVMEFEAETKKGYSTEKIYDSEIAAEQGTDGQVERVFKTEALEGHVQFELKFTAVADSSTQSGIAEAQERVEASEKNSAIHLPLKLRFLETLSNKAFREFFNRYNQT